MDIKLSAREILEMKRAQLEEAKKGDKKHHIYVDGKHYKSFDTSFARKRHLKAQIFQIAVLRKAKLVELISSNPSIYDVYYKDGYSTFNVGKKSVRCDV